MDATIVTKSCKGCQDELPLTAFYLHSMGKLGRQARCIKCQANEQRVRLSSPEVREAHSAAVRRGHLRRRYGITPEQYDALLSAQDWGCALCGCDPQSNGRALAVDHDHATGEVRGLLCKSCNVALERAENDGWLAAAGDYLRRTRQ